MATMKKAEPRKTVFKVKDYLATAHGAVHDVLPENKKKKKVVKPEDEPKKTGE